MNEKKRDWDHRKFANERRDNRRKLTMEEAQQIRKLYRKGLASAIGKAFNVSAGTVIAIAMNRRYKA
jgi:DNA invertase Pin-like site-specific DNA recombinase